MPPIDFHDLLNAMVPAGGLKEEISRLLVRKIAGDEMDLEPRIRLLHQFLESEINSLEAYANTLPPLETDPTDKLDELFRRKLKEVWGNDSAEKGFSAH